MVIFRSLRNDDLVECKEIARECAASLAYSDPCLFREGTFIQSVSSLLDSGALMSIVAVDERILGGIGVLRMVANYDHSLPVLICLFWYVRKNSRSGVGMDLLALAERWGKDHGYAGLFVPLPYGNPSTPAMMDRIGYAPIETYWFRRL